MECNEQHQYFGYDSNSLRRNYTSRTPAFPTIQSRATMSSTWQPTVAVNGSLKWMPVNHRWPTSTQQASISAAVLALASRSPQPSVLSRLKMSGAMPSSKANTWPTQPTPICASSRVTNTPRLVPLSSIPFRL
ncbi:hypothetical protein MCOR31_009522 [Pyricularia oryzae]|nr:hypothetical protein MCOR31_009522 [Pyricularia oryzae]